MVFDQGVIFGTGKLALDCAQILNEKGLPFRIYDTNDCPSKVFARQAAGKGYLYFDVPYKRAVEETDGLSGRVLLVSAINPRILPTRLLEKPGLLAVNCHQALLPAHPGRNAEMWAIFEEDIQTGITWHTAVEDVDAGEILIQKAFPLTEADTAYTVFRRQMEAAREGFAEIAEDLLNGTLSGRRQQGRGRLRYSWEVPEDCLLDPAWPGHKISAFLRAVDYRGLAVLKKTPRILWEGRELSWKSYTITASGNDAELAMRDGCLIIKKDGYYIELKGLQKQQSGR